MTSAAGTLLAASGSLLGLQAADSAEGVVLAVIGAVLAWHGARVYTGRRRVTPRRGNVYLRRPDIDLAAAWCGSGLLVAGIGALLSVPASVPVDVLGLILLVAGGVVFVAGLAFYVYLPRPLRPAWERGAAAASPAGSSPAGSSPADRPLRLVHHVLPGNTRTSEEEAREITGVDRPRLLVPGRISGPLPYKADVSRTPRSGALWVVPGRVLFVQSAGDDRRLGETYFVEIPAAKLHGMRAGGARGGKQTLQLDADQGTLGFEYDGDAETLRHDILEVLDA